MNRRLLCLTAVLPLLAGCGGGGGADSTPQTQPQPADISKSLVLTLGDFGAAFVNVDADTRKIPRALKLRSESPLARAADRRSYLGGYVAMFAGNRSVVGSYAADYRTAADAAATVRG